MADHKLKLNRSETSAIVLVNYWTKRVTKSHISSESKRTSEYGNIHFEDRLLLITGHL